MPASARPAPGELKNDAKARGGVGVLLRLLAVVGCVTVADLLLKRGAAGGGGGDDLLNVIGVGALRSPFTLAGIVFHLMGLAAWLWTLRTVPLTIAYCFTAVQQVTIAIGAWLWLGERISPMRWAGIGIVCVGVMMLAPVIVASNRPGKGEEL